MKEPTCPNCGRPVTHPNDGCVLKALMSVLADRGLPYQRVDWLMKHTDVDALWSDIGPILDKLEDGGYVEQ